MKRSSGVTALAVMLIIFGLGQLVGSISQFAVGPRAAEQQIAGLKAHINSAFSGSEGGKTLPPERRARLNAKLDKAGAEMQEYVTSPVVRMRLVINALLALAAIVGGFGALALYEWARELVVWQAWGAVVLTLLFAWNIAPSASIAEATLELLEDPAIQQHTREIIYRGQMLTTIVAVASGALWNGFLIWFFNRRQVAGQFRAAQPAEQAS